MKFLFLPLLISGSAFAAPATLDFNGQTFAVAKSTRAVKVAPSAASVRLAPDAASPGCEEIYGEIQRRAYLFDACTSQPELSACRALKKSLRLLAEGRTDTDEPIDPSAGRSFTIAAPGLEGVDLPGLRAASAAAFHVKAENVEVVAAGAQPALSGELIPAFAPDSAFAQVSRLVPFRAQDVVQANSASRLVSHNSLYACDLAGGKAWVTGTAVSDLSGTDHVPGEAVDAAWAVYGGLSGAAAELDAETRPLVKAAMIGYQIAHASPANLPDDPAVTVSALFQRLFDLSGAVPSLRSFGDREAMRTIAFPDVSFREQLSQKWRMQ